MEHQNWEYTVFTGKINSKNDKNSKSINKAIQQGKEVETIKKSTSTKKKGLKGSEIHKILEKEEYKLETVSLEFKIALQQARISKELTQQKLANLVNEKQTVIQEYESGKAIPNPTIISKLEKVLGVKLPRQKKEKIKKKNEFED